MGGRGRCRGPACCRSQHVNVYPPLGLTIQHAIFWLPFGRACHLCGRSRIAGRPPAIPHPSASAACGAGRAGCTGAVSSPPRAPVPQCSTRRLKWARLQESLQLLTRWSCGREIDDCFGTLGSAERDSNRFLKCLPTRTSLAARATIAFCCGSANTVLAGMKENGAPLLQLRGSRSYRILDFQPDAYLSCIVFREMVPACSRALCILRMVEKFPFTVPSFCSIRRREARPTPALRESLSWLQPRSARAARI